MRYKLQNNAFRQIISGPFIWIMIIPLIILDIFIEFYQNICFRLWKLPLIKRREYIKIDRHKLSYLDFKDKIACAYCGYGNGLMHYATTIAAKTEEYWCGIQHEKNPNFKAPNHHKDFLNYGDKETFEKEYYKKIIK